MTKIYSFSGALMLTILALCMCMSFFANRASAADMQMTMTTSATMATTSEPMMSDPSRIEKLKTLLGLMQQLLALLQQQQQMMSAQSTTTMSMPMVPATTYTADQLKTLHIMGDGMVMLGDGTTIPNAVIGADGMVTLPDGQVVKPVMDMRQSSTSDSMSSMPGM